MIPTLVPPKGLGYTLACSCCSGTYGSQESGVYLPTDGGNPPVLGEVFTPNPDDVAWLLVINVWSIL